MVTNKQLQAKIAEETARFRLIIAKHEENADMLNQKLRIALNEAKYEKSKTAHYLEQIGKLQDRIDELLEYNRIMCNAIDAMNEEIVDYREVLVQILGISAKKGGESAK